MASTESTVLQAWVTRLSVPNGAGSYVYDLSSPGDVRLGSPTQSAARECVYVDNPVPVVSDEAPLGKIRVTLTVSIFGFVGGTANAPGTQMRAVADLYADLKRAVYADRTLGVSGVLDAGLRDCTLRDPDTGTYRVACEGFCYWLEAAP